MSFISYAPNFEDVTLWRALGHLDGGVYVDIDARGPGAESVGRAFRERGWKGVHVVADSRTLADSLPATDIVIEARVASPLRLAASAGQAAGAMARADCAARDKGDCSVDETPVLSLDALFDRIGMQTIHWMRLDLGHVDSSPFDGWCRSAVRPWVLLVSHAPAIGAENAPDWEAQLLAKGYRRVGADAVNRYYVCASDAFPARQPGGAPHLAAWFSEPAAGASPAALPQTPARDEKLVRAQRQLQELQRKLFDAQATLVQADERAAKAEIDLRSALDEARQVAVLQRQLQDLYASTSWRVTRPMRWVSRLRRSPRSALGEVGVAARNVARRLRARLMHRTINFILARPALKRVALRAARHFPEVFQRYKTDIKVVMAAAPAPGHSSDTTVIGPRFRTLIVDELGRLETRPQQGKA